PERAKDFAKSMSGSAGSSSEKIDSAPRSLRESLLFPYEQGGQFVMQLYRRGGWRQVSQAFTDLPQSTEQILHADKYFAREAPVKVEMPDISKQLGKGWRRIEYDVNGEWGYYQILDEYLKSSGQSEQAAAGWGGDRYALYEGPQGELVLAQMTAWDSQQDATEFYDAYQKRIGLRYKDATPITSQFSDFYTKWFEGEAWHTGEGIVILHRNGERVLVLEGLPEKANIRGLAEMLAGIKIQNKKP
ncbi:MAG: hypothetical protein JOZ52_07095, partial [Acidobacteria bacterium]|nr:hypothetical protein [Acidobacteriota bacterium]